MVTSCILVIPNETDRDIVEQFDGNTYPTIESFNSELKEKIADYDENIDYLFTLKDFVIMVNNENFNDVENWIGYVYIEENFNTLLR
jgi:hypothetical protein